jgi:hypothetical protein
LNGDGHPDLVLGFYFIDNVISVLLGNGDGTFRPPVTYNTGGGSGAVALADVNGDGNLDVMVAEGSGRVGVMLGNGDGTFQSVRSYSTGGQNPDSIAVADVNHDGKLDLIVANQCPINSCPGGGNSDLAVGVLLGNGDGTFQAPTVYASGGHLPLSVVAADVNGDGRPDLIVANDCSTNDCLSPGAVGVLLGNGDGTFQAPVSYLSGGYSTYSAAVGDVNGDGRPDILVANESSDTIGVLLGNGDGTFQPAVVYDSGGIECLSIKVADVNGDEKPDLLVANSSDATVGVLLGNGDGTFKAAQNYHSGGPELLSIAVADVNGDGRPDLIAVNYEYPGSVGVLLNNTGVHNPTSTSLTSSLNPSIYGQKVSWTATVTSSGSIMPTGTVRFKWQYFTEAFTIGSAILNSSGVATLTKSNLNADAFPLMAVYSGDAANLGSTSAVLNQVVLEATSAAKITSTPNPSTLGLAVTFTATITSPTVIPTGPVTFMVGTKVLGTAQLSSGKAKFTTSTLPIGSTKVTAIYYGDSNIAKSSASVIQTVQ